MRVLMNLLKWVGVALGVVVIVFGAFLVAMRFADGPYGMVAGGPFTSGERYTGPEPDWSFVKDRDVVEFQLLEPARSRTTWIIEHEGRIYVPCGYMDTPIGRVWKHWPVEAEQDGRAVLRIDGVLYDRQLVRIREGAQLPALLSELARKYLGGTVTLDTPEAEQAALAEGLNRIAEGSLWVFELTPRN
jgi:hypothetical protein